MSISQQTDNNSINILDQYMNVQEQNQNKISVKKSSLSIRSPQIIDHLQSQPSDYSKSNQDIDNSHKSTNKLNSPSFKIPDQENNDIHKSPQKLNSSEEVELKSCKRRSQSKGQKTFKANLNRPSRKSQYKIDKKKFWSFITFIQIVVYVQKFISKITEKQKNFKIVSSLKQPVFDTINDITYFTALQLKEDKDITQKELKNVKGIEKMQMLVLIQLRNISSCFSKIWNTIPTLQPNQKLKVFMDCWQSFWILYRMFFTSVKLSFFLVDMKKSTELISYEILMIINISFIFDMLMNFHTGYYEKGTIEQSKIKIAKKYFQSSLLSDIIVQGPLILAYFVNENSNENLILVQFFLDILIFFKWFGLKSTFNRLEIVFTENEKIAQLFPLITLSMQMLIIAHIVGLFYHGVAVFEIQILNENENTWLHLQQLLDHKWFDKYIHSLYWAVSTMVTILLYVPQTNVETIFAIGSIFLMTGIFGYALNTIGMILTDISKKSKEHKNDRQMANRFFNKRKIPEKLRERIILYLEFQYQQQQEKNQEEEGKIIGKLSKQLQSQLKQEINQSYMDKFNIIKHAFSVESKEQIIELIQEEHYSPDEQITKKSDSLFVLLEGSAEVYVQRGKHSKQMQVYKIVKDQVFGTYSFLTGEIFPYRVKSLESCLILKIERQSFLKIIKENEIDFQQFCQMKDTMVQKLSFQDILSQQFDNLNCEICCNQEHFSYECKYVNYKVNKIQLIYDYNNLDTQLRGQFNRFEEKNYNAYDIFQEINITVQEIFSEDVQGDEELRQIALYWRQIYETIIPAKEFDTNTQMYEQQSHYTNRSFLNQNPQNMLSEYEDTDIDVSKQSIKQNSHVNLSYDQPSPQPVRTNTGLNNNNNRRRQSKLLSLKAGSSSYLNNTAFSNPQLNPNSQISNFNNHTQGIVSSYLASSNINSQLNTINERKNSNTSYSNTTNQMSQSNNTNANKQNNIQQQSSNNQNSYLNLPVINTTQSQTNIQNNRRRMSVRRQSLLEGMKGIRQQLQQQHDNSFQYQPSSQNSNLVAIVEQSEPSQDNPDPQIRLRKTSNGLQANVASNLNLNNSILNNMNMNNNQNELSLDMKQGHTQQNIYPQYASNPVKQKINNNNNNVSIINNNNNQSLISYSDTQSQRMNKRKKSTTVGDILNPNNISLAYQEEKMNNSLQHNNNNQNQSYYQQNDTYYQPSHFSSRNKSNTITTYNQNKNNQNTHYLPNISKDFPNLRKINDWDFCTFDKPKSWDIYLPKNNLLEVIKSFKKYQQILIDPLLKDPIKNKVVIDLMYDNMSENSSQNNPNNPNLMASFNIMNQQKLRSSQQLCSNSKLIQTPQFNSQIQKPQQPSNLMASNNNFNSGFQSPSSNLIINQNQSNRLSQLSNQALLNDKRLSTNLPSSILNNYQQIEKRFSQQTNQQIGFSQQNVNILSQSQQQINNSRNQNSNIFTSSQNNFGSNSNIQPPQNNTVIPNSIMGNKINKKI